MRTLMLAAVAVLGSVGPAQGRTWIVDAANGTGTNFTDLPPAVAAAADGDVLIVKPGNYSRFTVGKGITILGSSSAWVVATGTTPAVEVVGVPAGKTLAIRGMFIVNFDAGLSVASLRLLSCAGRLHLDGVATANSEARPLQISGCKLVTLRNLTSSSSNWPQITNSTVVVTRSRLSGQAGNYGPPPGGMKPPSPGLVATNSTVTIVDCPASGGNAAYTMYAPPQSYGPQPALVANGCTLTLLGTAAHAIAAGTNSFGAYYTTPAPAIAATGSVVEIDPAIPLSSYLGAPLIAGATSVTTTSLAALDAASTSVGGTLSASLRSTPGDPFLLALGLPSDPTASPLGTLFVDLATFVTLGLGAQGGTGTTPFTLPVPNDAALRGVTFALQAANGYAGGTRIGLTNPVHLTLD